MTTLSQTASLWINTGRYQQFRWNDGEIRPDWKKVNYRVRVHGCEHTVWKTRVSKTRVCKTRVSKTRMFKTRVCKTQVCKTTGIESKVIKRIADLNTNAYPYRVFPVSQIVLQCAIILFCAASQASPLKKGSGYFLTLKQRWDYFVNLISHIWNEDEVGWGWNHVVELSMYFQPNFQVKTMSCVRWDA